MSYTRTTWLNSETALSAANMNNIEDGVEEALDITRALFDLIYPVGSYYETSDSTFDPNAHFSGTWSLEKAGQVHVSAGTGYAIGSEGGSKDAVVPYHNHTLTNPTVTVPKHTHGFTQPTISAHNHKITDDTYNVATSASSAISRTTVQSGTGATNIIKSDGGTLNRGSNYTGTTQPFATGGAVQEKAAVSATVSGGSIAYAGTSGNTTNANMQPYIVVNRWHRTA